MLFALVLLLAQPARFHHVHFNSLEPADDMEFYARKYGAVKVILQGLGVGVRMGDSYVLFERVDEESPAKPFALDQRWFQEHLGVGEIKLENPLNRPVDHIAFSYPNLAEQVQRLEGEGVKILDRRPGRAMIAGPGGIRVELVEDTDIGKAAYWCPMDPQVRAANPGNCPVCGMRLVPLDPGEYVEYPVDLEVTPRALRAGQPGRLRFRIHDPHDEEPAVSFEVVHEKLFHLFIVSRDMTYFAHIHPEIQKDGSFVIETTFPRPGPYQLYADFFPTGGTPQVIQKTFVTAGYQGSLLDVTPKLKLDGVLERVEQGTRVRLESSEYTSGRKQNLVFTLDPSSDLEQYLGAWGHLLILSEDLGDYVHSHATRDGAQLTFDAIFPRPGLYRVWAQFQRAGKVLTAAFTVSVSRLK